MRTGSSTHVPKAEGGSPVLLVMSQEAARATGRALLTLGYEVRGATDIRHSEALLDEGLRPCVVFTEVALPDGNWRDLVERLKARVGNLSVVLCAGVGTAELWWDALDSGVADVLTPPYDVPSLTRVLPR